MPNLRPLLGEQMRQYSEHLLFVKTFLKNPTEIGSAVPSSRFLVEGMLSRLNLEQARVVVEYGPGTGVLTKAILDRVEQKAFFFALETNIELCEMLRNKFPGTNIINDSAENVELHLERLGLDAADYVISSLPFALIKPEVCSRIMASTWRALRAGGVFVTYQYVHSRILTTSSFTRVHTKAFSRMDTSVVFRNFPPAFVFRCVK
ncbi:MAG: rRNA adenine N-6-methyltransferase family protein [Acidobacteriota bacterium]|nr:methyltransferase [Blastocatellia bacterium]MDW8413542.1 rRNA adenine N-6-methyltransferase family protein [Acidobacteriota bacterium]